MFDIDIIPTVRARHIYRQPGDTIMTVASRQSRRRPSSSEDDYRYNSVVIYDHIVRRAQRQLVTATSAPATVNATPGPAETNLTSPRHRKIITCCTGPAGPEPATRVHAYYNNIYFSVAFKVARTLYIYTSYNYGIIHYV